MLGKDHFCLFECTRARYHRQLRAGVGHKYPSINDSSVFDFEANIHLSYSGFLIDYLNRVAAEQFARAHGECTTESNLRAHAMDALIHDDIIRPAKGRNPADDIG